MSGLKLITFDLDNTLWPVDEVIRQAEQQSSDWLHSRFPEADQHLSAEMIRQYRDQLINESPGYASNLTALRKAAIERALSAAGLSHKDAVIEANRAFEVFHRARNQVSFFPGAIDVLEHLGDSYMLGALSNGNADLRQIGIADLFSFHHSAESVGQRKPAQDMFYAALKSAGVTPQEAVHVGDHPIEDIDTARRSGFHAIWANLLNLSWPEHVSSPSFHIHNLRELIDLLPLLED